MEAVADQELRVVIENRTGNHGQEAIRYYREEVPNNGLTLLQHVDDLASLYASKPDMPQDLIPLAIPQKTFSQLYVRNIDGRFQDDGPVSWEAVMAYYTANPDKPFTIALTGHHGSLESRYVDLLQQHFADIATDNQTPPKIIAKHYNKPTERYLSLIKGDADALIEQPGDVRFYLSRSMIMPLLTFYSHRFDIPYEYVDNSLISTDICLPEADLSYHDVLRFRGIFIHQDTPPERRAWLEQLLEKAIASDIFSDFNRSRYMNLVPNKPEVSAQDFFAQQIAIHQQLSREADGDSDGHH